MSPCYLNHACLMAGTIFIAIHLFSTLLQSSHNGYEHRHCRLLGFYPKALITGDTVLFNNTIGAFGLAANLMRDGRSRIHQWQQQQKFPITVGDGRSRIQQGQQQQQFPVTVVFLQVSVSSSWRHRIGLLDQEMDYTYTISFYGEFLLLIGILGTSLQKPLIFYLSNLYSVDMQNFQVGGLLGGAATSWLLGPVWRYESLSKDGRSVFADKAPIFFLMKRKRMPGSFN
ncbi:hypothetical protein HHK36_004349 [Tetracentron sinense]|uniref:Uncharacterized protein n=1 Tax=Tetracentron sinense TaxID=13715 RepID=A0A834ZUS1_TETSI|nr:hypothetical protein HHK36_004349 [Tetracentron sinense]